MQPKTPKVIQRDEVIKLGGKATSQLRSYLGEKNLKIQASHASECHRN